MTAIPTATRTAESTDRTPALAARRGRPTMARKAPPTRPGLARRLFNALMQSLAAPHV